MSTLKDNLIKAVSDNNLELIKIISKEMLDKEKDERIEYYYTYSIYSINPRLLIDFLDNRVISNKEKVISIFNHIIDYLKISALKESVERFFANQALENSIDIEPYLFDYYEFTLGYTINEIKNAYEVIIINDKEDNQ